MLLLNKESEDAIYNNRTKQMIDPGQILLFDAESLVKVKLTLEYAYDLVYLEYKEGVDYVCSRPKPGSKYENSIWIHPLKDEDNFRSRCMGFKDFPEALAHHAKNMLWLKRYKGKTQKEMEAILLKNCPNYIMQACLCVELTYDYRLEGKYYGDPEIVVKRV